MHVCMYVPNMLQPLNSIVIILSDNRTMYSDGEEGRGEEGGGRREGGGERRARGVGRGKGGNGHQDNFYDIIRDILGNILYQ